MHYRHDWFARMTTWRNGGPISLSSAIDWHLQWIKCVCVVRSFYHCWKPAITWSLFPFSLGDEGRKEEFLFSSLAEQLQFMVSEMMQKVSLSHTFYWRKIPLSPHTSFRTWNYKGFITIFPKILGAIYCITKVRSLLIPLSITFFNPKS